MADAPKRVAYILRDGRFGTVDEADVPDMPYGTRILTAKQAVEEQADAKQKAADEAVQQRYDELPTARKALGVVNSVIGSVNPLTFGQDSAAPPAIAAYGAGVRHALTGGLLEGGVRQGIDALAGHEAGDKYAAQVEQERTASPVAYNTGQVVGTGAGLVAPVGAAAEGLVAKGLARLGATGASTLGRAGIAATTMGARGLVEGGLLGAGDYAGEQLLQDKDLAVDKLFAATGTNALYGGITGAVLGGGGSLLASGAKGFTDMLATRRGAADLPKSTRVLLDQSTLDAGLHESMSAESPLQFDPAMRVRGDVHQRGKLPISEPFDLSKGTVSFDPDAGIAPRANGKFQGKVPAEDALMTSAKRTGVGLRGDLDAASVEARSPIKLAMPEPPPLIEPTGAKKLANKMAFQALGGTKGERIKALAHVAGGDVAVGEYINDNILSRLAKDGPWNVAKNARADEILALVQEDMSGRIGAGLSDAVKGTPARFNLGEMQALRDGMYRRMAADPTMAAGADTFWQRAATEMSAIGRTPGRVAADGTIDAADAFYIRSGLAKQAYEVRKVSGPAGDMYKDFLRQWDHATIDTIDRAGEAAGKSGVGDNIRYWKRQWQLARAAEDIATGGANQIHGNNMIGIREGIAGATAMMTGHPILGVVGPIALKVAKERGKALAAYALNQIADRGVLARLVARSDEQIGRAAKGLIAAPVKGVLEAHLLPPSAKSVVKTALARVAAFQNDPNQLVDHSSRDVEGFASHSPDIASAIVARHVQAMTFLSSKVPEQSDPDPLDPHAAPRMTASEQSTFAKYAWYVDKPDRFFEEVARGKITPEGAETAKVLAPRAFEQLQAETAEALALQLTRGNRLPFRQREMLGQLLDFAATPSQRPAHGAFLQQNLADVLPSDQPPSAAPAKSRRSSITPSGSALDRLEAGGPGHR